MTIGRLGAWSVAAARNRTHELRRMLDAGVDPLEKREERRAALSLHDLWQWYSSGALKRLCAASQRDIRNAWVRKIEPQLGAYTKVADLTRSDIQRLVDKVSKDHGLVVANRCHSYIRRMLRLAQLEGFVTSNVAAANIQRNAEYPRERFLTRAEVTQLLGILDEYDSGSGAAIKLLLLTGARKSEVLGMRWAEVDLATGVWTKPAARTKQRALHRVPLSSAAQATLRRLASKTGGQEFIFPGSGSTGHLTDCKKAWRAVSEAAGIWPCRLHDLRHSFASLIASGGQSLQVIGALLGHRQAQTTKRYAHLYDEDLRRAAESAFSFTLDI